MKHVLLFSGGLDSSVLLNKLLVDGETVHPLFIDYGHISANNEVRATSQIHEFFKKRFQKTLKSIVSMKLPLGDVAKSRVTGHYWPETATSEIYNLVPGRNTYLLMAAAAHAIRIRADVIEFAAIYRPGSHGDWTNDFVRSMNGVLQASFNDPPEVAAPFVTKTKREIVKIGKELGLPFHLVWTCYVKGPSPCGVCGSCTMFKKSGAEKLRRMKPRR